MMQTRFGFALALVLTCILPAQAQSPREQLQQLVTQLQATPADNALRERIIKLGAELRPPPAIPEDARRWFIRGNTAFGEATAEHDYIRAAALYDSASVIAPWWGDPYYNLAKALELGRDYAGAIRALRYFVLSAPPAEDTRKAQDYAYVLEERFHKHTAEATKFQITQKSDWAKAVTEWLKARYGNPPSEYARCGGRLPGEGCTREDALRESSWTVWGRIGSAGPWGVQFSGFILHVTGCEADEIGVFFIAPEDKRPTRYCGVVNGPRVTDVSWTIVQDNRKIPLKIEFFDTVFEAVECLEGSERCVRMRWRFE